MKRFWNHATAAAAQEGFMVQLDGKPMRIPGGAELRVASASLAEAIAAEWQQAGGQNGGEMSPESVPLTRLAGTAQDRIAPNPALVADALAAYAETDLLCYRAEHPMPLVVRQAQAWEPWLDWLEATHGARLLATEGLTPIRQDAAALTALREILRAQPAPILAGLGLAIPALGSLVLGLALAEGALDADGAYQLAHVDELFQAERWGDDAWATKRRTEIAADITLAARFIDLARQP